MTDPTRRDPDFRDPIFRDMAEQMTPDAALRRRLDERLAAEPTGPSVPYRSRRSRPSTWLAAAAAAALVVGIGGGVVAVLRDDGAPHVATTSTAPPAPADYHALYEAVAQAMATTRTDDLMAEDAVPQDAQKAPDAAPAPGPAGAPTARDDYTTTNVQVAGIDEADVVKTDGKVLYAATDRRVWVVALAGPDTRTLAQIDLEAGPSSQVVDLLLHDGTLVVIAQEHDAASTRPSCRCPSFYSCPCPTTVPGDLTVTQPQTVVRLYDVTDPSTPALRATSRQSGSYRTARLWQGVVYLVSDYSLWSQQVDPRNPATFVPLVGGPDGADEPLVPDDVAVVPCPSTPRYAVATAVDLRTGVRTGQQAVLGGADTVYMSAASLYLGGVSYPQAPELGIEDVPAPTQTWTGPTTSLVRLSLDGGRLAVAAQGDVPGQLVDQFALDEYDGRLRVVTTARDGWTDTANLYVLGPDLRQLGAVTDLAHDEQVKSVRFAGTVGYVVTFRQTDPLFAVDLSDPAHPTVTSELKIPGFSAYLHPWGGNRLVGLGYAGNGAGLSGGLKLSLFDVSDPYAVTEAQSLPVTGDYSDALDDHRAVLVDADRNLLGFPVSTWGSGSGAVHYLVYQVDAAHGFTLQHDLVVAPGSTTSLSTVRATRAENHLYVSWSSGLAVYQLATGTLVAQVDLR